MRGRRVLSERPWGEVTRAFQQFTRTESAGGIALLAGAAAALVWANSPWSDSYQRLLEHHVSIDAGIFAIDQSLHFWVNDVAMVLFFFLVGMEIKRELVLGELASFRRAVAPAAGALGGVLLPALLFLLIASGAEERTGWGVPMATDIAFALGVVALLGPRIPGGLKVLLLAIAIFDDLAAVTVIAVFYTETVHFGPLAIGFLLLGLMALANRIGVRRVSVYIVLGIATWIAVFESGVHPTTVGVALGLLTPWRSWHGSDYLATRAEDVVATLRDDEHAVRPGDRERRTRAILALSDVARETVAPLDRLEQEIHSWVAFAVVPLFALANAGVDLRGDAIDDALSSSATWGVAIGLALGKPLGIFAGLWLSVRLGATLPAGVTSLGLWGIGTVAGIGFTVALFVGQLAYPTPELLSEAKVGIIIATVFAGAVGFGLLRQLPVTPSGPTAGDVELP